MKPFYNQGWHGISKEGLPVYIDLTGQLNTPELFKVTTMERISRYWLQFRED
jgi:hypothetical protein